MPQLPLSLLLIFSMFNAMNISMSKPSGVGNLSECVSCGKSMSSLEHCRMVLHYRDGRVVGVCNIGCTVLELMKAADNSPFSVKVADFNSRQLIDAATAYWIVGSGERGPMIGGGMEALKEKRDAKIFIRSYGGKIATFDEAMQAAYKDLPRVMEEPARLKHNSGRFISTGARE